MAYNPNNANGQATMANSAPVTIASDQPTPSPHGILQTLVHKDAVYAATQISASIWAPASGKKFVITDITITTGGNVSGVVTMYDAASATAYSANTTPAIFRGEFAPTTSSKPGVVKSFVFPYVSTTANNNVLITTSAGINPLYIQINGYEI